MFKTNFFRSLKENFFIRGRSRFVMRYLLAALLFFVTVSLFGQKDPTEWKVLPKAKEKISYQKFTKDRQEEGSMLYERACQSCHGRPTKEEPALMVPSPGDPATKRFRKQTDGALFYKIRTGRELMPSFQDTFSQDEVYNIIAFIRSFHKDYEQPMPDLTGIFVPEFKMVLDFDQNIDKLVVKADITNKKGTYNNQGIEVLAYIKSMFGKFSLGKQITDKKGLAFFAVPADLPGDSKGNLTVIVKLRKGYGFLKKEQKMQMGRVNEFSSVVAGRHLFSTGGKAPVWLHLVFWGGLIAIWGIIIWTIVSLRKIKSYA